MDEDEHSKPERFIPPKHELEGVLRWVLSPETQFKDDKHRTESFCRFALDYFTVTGYAPYTRKRRSSVTSNDLPHQVKKTHTNSSPTSLPTWNPPKPTPPPPTETTTYQQPDSITTSTPPMDETQPQPIPALMSIKFTPHTISKMKTRLQLLHTTRTQTPHQTPLITPLTTLIPTINQLCHTLNYFINTLVFTHIYPAVFQVRTFQRP